MEDEQIWALYFAGIASLQYHPKNVPELPLSNPAYSRIGYAARIADSMLKEHRRRYPCRGSAEH